MNILHPEADPAFETTPFVEPVPVPVAEPVQKKDRIISLDVLRGFAILGILIMNIQTFSMIQSAYMNPTSFGDLTGLNKLVWMLSHIMADQKFMSIFSMLYGAGIILISQRAETKKGSAVGVHYRRTFWLLVIGAAHAYLLWYGDILFTYAMCAMVMFWVRKYPPWLLMTLAVLFITLVSVIWVLSGLSIPFWPQEQVTETLNNWQPGPELIQKEIDTYQGSWFQQLGPRITTSLMFQTVVFLIWTFWRVSGCMMLGMALFKWKVFSAERSYLFYSATMITCFLVGYPLIITGVMKNFAAGWTMEYSMFLGAQFNYWASLFVAIGYICMVMLICKLLKKGPVLNLFASIGRTALSNYLFQTVMCTFIFYGYGLGLFGTVSRTQQVFYVLGVWVTQVILTHFWMKKFRFGPVEWLWRSLTYWKKQPLKI